MEQTMEDARSAPERSVSESSVLCRGWRLGKKLAVAGVAVTSAPLVIPPLLFLSTVGLACAVPLCVYLAAFAATERVMSSILPLPSGEEPRESEVEAEPLDTVYACIAEEKGRMDDNDDDDVGGEEKPLVDVERESLVENENGEVVVLMAEEKKSEEMELGEGSENRESVHHLVIVEHEIVCPIENEAFNGDSLLMTSKEKQREIGEVGMDQEGQSDVGSTSMKEEDDENDVKGGIEVITEEQQLNEDDVKSAMEKEIDNVPIEIGKEEKLVKNEKEKEGFGIKEIRKEPIGGAEIETGAARLSMEHASIVENANGDVLLIVNDPKPIEDELLDKISPTSQRSVGPFDLESSDYASAVEDQSSETAETDIRVSTELVTNLPAETEAIAKDEDLYKEEKIWEEIYALRTIVGYTGTLSMSPVEELSALYTFAGVEAPVYVKSSPKLKEVNDMLQFLKSVIGVK